MRVIEFFGSLNEVRILRDKIREAAKARCGKVQEDSKYGYNRGIFKVELTDEQLRVIDEKVWPQTVSVNYRRCS
jgi:predicted DNA binding protein